MLTLSKFTALTRFEQSLFGLPFVLTGTLLAFFADPIPTISWKVIFIIPAFFAARISGISFNQLVDRKIDILNPRTKERPLPSQMVSEHQAKFVSIFFLLLFFFFAWCINFLCFCISLVAGFIILFYSFMKRFHYSCHYVMGLIHSLAPIGAYLVIAGEIHFSVICLSLVPLFSVAAVDIVYALQDLEFDKKEGLHSIPSRFGLETSLKIAKVSHGLALLSVALFGLVSKLPLIFYFSLICLGFLFYNFYKSYSPARFFATTVGTSATVFLFTLSAYLWHVLL